MAQTFPTRPVRLIVGFPPGGPGDISARLEGQWLSEKLGQPFIVENRPGAGGNIGTEMVVRAPPEGYTLFLVNTANVINASLYEKLSFDFLRDIAPVGGIIRAANIMEVHPSVPAKTVPEFIAYAKANPGKINYASGGNGTLTQMAVELFKMMAKVDMVHVPYRGSGTAVTALLPGEVQAMFDAIPSSIEHIRAGKLRALAVTTATRSEALPDTPVVADFMPQGYGASGCDAELRAHPLDQKERRDFANALLDRLKPDQLVVELLEDGAHAKLGELVGKPDGCRRLDRNLSDRAHA